MTRFVVTVQAYCRHAGAASSTACRRLAARLGAMQGEMGRPLNPFSPTYTSLAGWAERSEAQRKTFGFREGDRLSPTYTSAGEGTVHTARTGAKLRLCSGQGPRRCKAATWSLVGYPLCCANP